MSKELDDLREIYEFLLRDAQRMLALTTNYRTKAHWTGKVEAFESVLEEMKHQAMRQEQDSKNIAIVHKLSGPCPYEKEEA